MNTSQLISNTTIPNDNLFHTPRNPKPRMPRTALVLIIFCHLCYSENRQGFTENCGGWCIWWRRPWSKMLSFLINAKTCITTGTIEQGDWKRTINHYCIIMHEHTMLAACVFLFEELKTCPKMFQNRTNWQFPWTHQPISNWINFSVNFK